MRPFLETAVGGQYPRPWTTDSQAPEGSRVFIVGYNQATPYQEAFIDARGRGVEVFINALFNRPPNSCDGLYEEARRHNNPADPDESRTRRRIVHLRNSLANFGPVLETNMICYATKKVAELRRPEHTSGREVGRKAFYELLRMLRPPVMVVHGVDANRDLEALLRVGLPSTSEGLQRKNRKYPKKLATSSINGKTFETTVISTPHFSRHIPDSSVLSSQIKAALSEDGKLRQTPPRH